MGLRVKFGHAGPDVCRSPNAKVVTVITHAGIFEVDVDFCGCATAQDVDMELAGMGWVRAGIDSYTCATQDVLTLTGEVSESE